MATLTQLVLDGDGTIDTTNLSHDAGTGAPWYTHCNDAPDGGSSDYVTCNGSLTNGTYDAWFSLSDVDADFESMLTLNIDCDIQASGFVNDTCNLLAQIADGDNSSTFLTDSVILGSQSVTTRDQRNRTFGSLTGTKAQWNTAHLRLRWNYTKLTSPDPSASLRIFGLDIDGTYTPASAATPSNLTLLGVGKNG